MEDLSQYQETVVGSYRLFQLAGVGPVSRAHLAERKDWPGRKVVVKLFEALPLRTREEQDQVLEEVRLLTYLEHLGLLPILDDGIHEQMLYLVSPYVEGQSLRQRLSTIGSDLLPLKEALALLRQVGEALQFAHMQGIVHANLKPENIFIQRDGTVLLADFLLPTLARSVQATRLLSTFSAFYMAPEQFSGTPTPLSDQYALACLAYELLTGQLPFEADNLTLLARLHSTQQPLSPAQIQPKRAQHVEQAILKALAKRPDKRYPDIQAFLVDLSAPPPLVSSASVQETTVIQAPSAPASSGASTLSPAMLEAALRESREKPIVVDAEPGVYEEATVHLPATPPDPQNEGQALVPYQQAALQAQRKPVTRFSRRQILLIVALVGSVLLASVSGLLFSFAASTNNHTQARAVTPASTAHSAVSPSQTLPGVTPSSTIGSISLQPSPTATPVPTTTSTPTAGASSTVTSRSAISCSVQYTVSSQWSGGFVARLNISNTGSTPIQNWTLQFSFSAGQQVSNGWNGNFTQHKSQVTVTNVDNNATIVPGDSATPGFQGTCSGSSNPAPTSFKLNGVTCS